MFPLDSPSLNVSDPSLETAKLEEFLKNLKHLQQIDLTSYKGSTLMRRISIRVNQIIPQLIANKDSNEPIRVWSAGCASGEETYSLFMLLAETLGIEQFQQRVRL